MKSIILIAQIIERPLPKNVILQHLHDVEIVNLVAHFIDPLNAAE
jgi:hypothetical protein